MGTTKMEKENLPSGSDLIALGAKPGPRFGALLTQARTAMQSGQTWESVSTQLRNQIEEENSRVPVRIEMRSAPLPIPMAAVPKTDEEHRNMAAAVARMEEVTRCPRVSKAALMPDACPTGSQFGSIPVGGAIAAENAIIPAAHSADLFCSMWASFLPQGGNTPKWEKLLDQMSEITRFGPYLRRETEILPHQILEEIPWGNPFLRGLEEKARLGLGTQGDGNHFAYLGEAPLNDALLAGLASTERSDIGLSNLENEKSRASHLTALVTHHGSRNFGAIVYKRGILAAITQTNGQKSELGDIPQNLCWLDLSTQEGRDYKEALFWVGRWTQANHEVLHRAFSQATGLPILAAFGNEHNAVWENPQNPEEILHGKGATPAWNTREGKPQIGVIPLNMASPILLTTGAANPTYLGFSPHGAGRNRSRSETMAAYKNPETKEIIKDKLEGALQSATKGILVRWWNGKADLSETPLGYKNPQEIKEQIKAFKLAHVFAEISPRASIMAGEILAPWKKKKKTKAEI